MDGLAIAAAITELRPAAEGGAIRAVHEPVRGSIVIRGFSRAEFRILIAPRIARFHATRLVRPNPPVPSPYVMQLRKHLIGGRIRSIEQFGWDRIVAIDVERRAEGGGRSYRLIAELVGRHGNLILIEEDRILGALYRDERCAGDEPYVPPPPQAKRDPRFVSVDDIEPALNSADPAGALVRGVDGIGRTTAEDLLAIADVSPGDRVSDRVASAIWTLIERVGAPQPHVTLGGERATFYRPPGEARPAETFGDALDLATGAPRGEPPPRSPSRARIERALERRVRTAERLAAWLASGEEETLRRSADLLMIHHTDIEPGAREATVIDPATGEPARLHLDPTRSAIENAQELYERAKRIRRGRPRVRARLDRLRREAEILRGELARLAAGEEPEGAAWPLVSSERARPTAPGTPARRFRIGGYTVLVGRNARENDRLLREARPDDIWLHARDVSGSHVIIRRGRGEDVPRSVLERAAQLAGWFSKARGEARIDVSVAAAKHVRKPKGAPPGLAIVQNEDTLTVESKDPGAE